MNDVKLDRGKRKRDKKERKEGKNAGDNKKMG